MIENMTEQLTQISMDTIEKLTFAFASQDEDVNEDDIYDFQIVTVDFSGWFSGSLNMKISKHILSELTRNMLGIDDDESVSDEQNNDMLKELLNIICGNLLPEVGGSKAIFSIGTPAIHGAGMLNADEDEFNVNLDTILSIDDGYCQLSLRIKEDIEKEIVQRQSDDGHSG
jgi:CheY-specific phosphatase CheX